MAASHPSAEDLLAEIADLRTRLEEAEDTLRAIREGEVDALVVYGPAGEQIYNLKGADYSYRILIEAINEGAGILAPDGDILYGNQQLAEILGAPLERLVGTCISDYVEAADRELMMALLEHGRQSASKGEVSLRNRYGVIVPAYLSFRSFNLEEAPGAVCLVVTDLTQQKRQEAILAEEQLSRAIFEQAEAVILVVDAEGRILRASHEAHQICRNNLLLRQFDEVLRLESFDTTGGKSGPAASKPFPISSILQGKIFQGLEVSFHPPEGREPLEMLLNAGPLRGSQGEVMGAVVTLTDITERKRAEEALKAAHIETVSEKNRLEAVMEALPVGVAILNERGGHVRSNTMFERMWGSRHPLPQEVADYSVYQAWWVDTGKPVQPEEWASARVVKQGEAVIDQIMEIQQFDGTHRFVVNSAVPILNNEGKVTECAVAILDITELQRSKEALKRAHDELEQRVKAGPRNCCPWWLNSKRK
jgi:PAS domain S-box-containing protein